MSEQTIKFVSVSHQIRFEVECIGAPGVKGDNGDHGDPGVGLPAGGTTGQIAAKASDDDYDFEWVDAPSGSGGSPYTAAQILAKLVTVDGADSGLDADLLDGQHASAFAATGHTHAGVYDPAGTAATAVTTHESATNPHPQYLTTAEGDAAYAPVAQGVTGGDAHDHNGGDGAQIAYTSLSGLPTLGSASSASTTDFDASGAATSAVASHASGSGVHSIASVTGLQTALDGKEASGVAASAVSAHASGSGVHTIAGVTGLQTALDGKSVTSHNHDGSYDALGAATAATAALSATLAVVATSGAYDDLSGLPTIPAAQVNADWNAASGVAQILNKPTLGTAATLDVGTSANRVVQLDGSARLPAVDGSQLTGISGGGGGSVPTYVSTPAVVLCTTLFGGL